MKALVSFGVGIIAGWAICRLLDETAEEDYEPDYEYHVPELGESQRAALANYQRLGASVAPLVAEYIRNNPPVLR